MPPAPHPRPSGTFDGTDLGDEYLFYDRERDQVHVLNGTAREIFLLLDGSRSEEDVAREVARRYEVDLERAIADVAETLRRLRELGVVA